MTTPDTADTAVERVVLLDEAARPIGSMPKSEGHTADTPLHSAFSCYLIDDEDLPRKHSRRVRGAGRVVDQLLGSSDAWGGHRGRPRPAG